VFVTLERVSIHAAKLVSEYVGSTDGRRQLHFLSPYSPPLNPAEQVWKSIKERGAEQKPFDRISVQRLNRGAPERPARLSEAMRAILDMRVVLAPQKRKGSLWST